jgi:cation diffusion facilitator CzcD-associated flavoprotein CzcO
LAALEARLAHDLRCLNHPPAEWVKGRAGPDGARALDVAIIGAGMVGQAAAFALLREGISNIRVFDRARQGAEGPWATYARMPTLRSPKDLTGPALGMGPLTFRAWHEASFGGEAWDRLYKIPNLVWRDYLLWLRRVLNLPVENGVEVLLLAPVDDLFRLDLKRGAANATVFARRVVLATGREGLGVPAIPAPFVHLPRRYWAHSAEAIDFARWKGRCVAVVGASASAFDNAATALDAGAASAHLYCRRTSVPPLNKFKSIVHPGFVHGHVAAGDAWRWRSFFHAFAPRVAPPHESLRRLAPFAEFKLRLGEEIRAARVENGTVVLETSKAVRRADFVVLATGFTMDPRHRPELDAVSANIATWRECYVAPPEERSEELGRFPYLAEDYAFTTRVPGTAPHLARLHCFNYAGILSHGALSGDVPSISHGAERLARGIARAFYVEDRAAHAADVAAYDERELKGDELPARAYTDETETQ